jgi:hypothetical protein
MTYVGKVGVLVLPRTSCCDNKITEWASQGMCLYILPDDTDTANLQNIFLFRQLMIYKENIPMTVFIHVLYLTYSPSVQMVSVWE